MEFVSSTSNRWVLVLEVIVEMIVRQTRSDVSPHQWMTVNSSQKGWRYKEWNGWHSGGPVV